MYPFMHELYRKVFILADFSVFKLYGLFMLVWLTEQVLSIGIENIVWGKTFPHWFDVGFTVVLFAIFAMFAAVLADWKDAAYKQATPK